MEAYEARATVSSPPFNAGTRTRREVRIGPCDDSRLRGELGVAASRVFPLRQAGNGGIWCLAHATSVFTLDNPRHIYLDHRTSG